MTRSRLSHADLPPRIETERLLLRPWRSDDLPALHEALIESVDHLMPWIPWATPEAPTTEESLTRLTTWMAEFQSDTNFIYAAFDRTGTHLVGGLGLFGRVGPEALEIGYWVRRTRAGEGLATEGTEALTRVGFGLSGIARIEIHVDTENAPSRKVPEKLGYTRIAVRSIEGRHDGRQRELAVFSLTRSEFAATRGP